MQRHIITLIAICLLAPTIAAQSDVERRRTPIVKAVEKVAPSVVSIQTQRRMRSRHPLDSFFARDEDVRGSQLRNSSLGSGVFIDAKGYVITNDHVVRQADRIIVVLTDGRQLDAAVVGRDAQNDLAILKVEGDGTFPAARLGRIDDLMLGETTIALGNPFGLSGSVTAGILSAKNRSVTFQGKEVFDDFLQTSAVINPGNSGGPLINIIGEVIGINVAIHSRGPGIGFAIPVSRVREVVYDVLDPRVARRAWLGIDVAHDDESSHAVITQIDHRGPAGKSGLEAGDVIFGMRGEPIDSWIDFRTTVAELPVGRPFNVRVKRGGRIRDVSVSLEPPPASPTVKALFQQVGFEFGDLTEKLKSDLGNMNGIVVSSVPQGSDGEKMGLVPGDVIYKLGRVSVQNVSHVVRVIETYRSRYRSIPFYLYRPQGDEYFRGELRIDR